ncbi:sigma 54-interacting transcriptional regulator [Ruminococcaceae bacterium OttesenSCG-928-D13]|nr:sigma 54-interacting transcriptional regulator [Ruminococcaceae bacterium OttesenSCG-928-D13]
MAKLDIERILDMYNYFDGAIITDEQGVILYYSNSRSDIYDHRRSDIIGKKLLDLYPSMAEEESSIMQVLKTGKPIYDRVQTLVNDHGQHVTNMYSTLPIIRNGEIVGAIDLSRCINQGMERESIVLPQTRVENADTVYQVNDIITTSTEMKRIKALIPKIANTDSAVLIYGETGTGKEMVAQSIHAHSGRSSHNFVSQNCAAIPPTLFESILFGTVKGSYTGAEDRPGLFETANGGTFFLDEINSLDLNLQAKILKAIEEQHITRIGSTRPVSFDIKIVAAVNEDPTRCVAEKKIREDLFYRLSTVFIEIPPLRERLADIEVLTDYFVSTFNARMNKNVIGVDDEVRTILMNYSWPGNVRELKNVIEGAFNIIDSRLITRHNLPQYIFRNFDSEIKRLEIMEESLNLSEKVDTFEKRLIIQALDSTPSTSAAATKLGITKQSLNYKLQKYNLKKSL